MKKIHAELLGVVALLATTFTAEALVLCVNPSGAIVARESCRPSTTQLDPAAVGLVGPAGPQGEAGPAGPSDAYTNYGPDDFQRIAEGTTQTVSSVTLPVGSYTLAATVSGIALGDARFMSCYFISFGTLSGNPALLSFDDAKMPLLGEVPITTDNTSVFLCCSALEGAFDVLGEMIATRVGTITPSL